MQTGLFEIFLNFSQKQKFKKKENFIELVLWKIVISDQLNQLIDIVKLKCFPNSHFQRLLQKEENFIENKFPVFVKNHQKKSGFHY